MNRGELLQIICLLHALNQIRGAFEQAPNVWSVRVFIWSIAGSFMAIIFCLLPLIVAFTPF